MIIDVYAFICGAALFFLAMGYFFREQPILRLAGYFLLIFSGLIMADIPLNGVSAGGIEYRTGATIATNGTVQTVEYSYATYTSHTYGYIIAVLGVLLLIQLLFDKKVSLL